MSEVDSMTLYIFFYNIVKVKSKLKKIFNFQTDRFVLVTGQSSYLSLSPENKSVFEEIIILDRFDFAHVDERLHNLLTKNSNKNIKILTNEESLGIVCAQLREKYHVAGASPYQILPFVDKVVMKERLKSTDIRAPKYLDFDLREYQKNPESYLHQVEEKLSYPMIAKPTDSFGSIDTIKINSFSDLEQYVKRNAVQNKHFEIDEFIEGNLYHCDGLVKNKKIVIFLSCLYNTPCMNFTKGVPLGSFIVDEKNPLHSHLFQFTQHTLQLLNIPDGAYHLEVFVNKKQEIIFLEVGARTPGALLIPTYEKMFDVNLEEQHYRIKMGLPYIDRLPPPKIYCAWMMFPQHDGIVRGYNKPEIKSEYQIHYLVKLDQPSRAVESLLDVEATIVLENKSREALHEDYLKLQSFKPISYK